MFSIIFVQAWRILPFAVIIFSAGRSSIPTEVEDATKIDHPYYRTQNTMEAYLRRAGFGIEAIDYAADHLHVSYLCQLAAPSPDALPDPAAVRDLFREIRFVQNAPRP